MAKMVLSDPESGRAWNIELKDKVFEKIIGKKIGDIIKGSDIGFPGYEIRLTGGTDRDGFPMRRDLEGARRPKLLLRRGPGYRPKEKGVIRRKRVRGNVYVKEIAQINAVIVKKGKTPVEEIVEKLKEEQEKK